ncbi:Gfo/Idh/MocA family oxidoreductase [Salinimicrobium tongyeongense]|uniref:Gfo/Idh/MocA family oxidoreductase n=1 Tax=Salinimicrobium tongyeongense TaxID=2809707 RepID=A0ABY6NP27_9FLAO|nr:Gfo/Idh/MocA family oxidoreductase [Salinimicrobium tongyeongense]UZH54647.1 Gfo/Idh/MocA family oxidoreductase [Salinimicrobium tongyeongense]
MNNLSKVTRFFLIYGFGRAIIKVAGRTRNVFLHYFFPKLFFDKRKKSISLIGCGQFGFSTISYFLLKKQGNKFLECFDTDKENQNSTANFWQYQSQDSVNNLLANPACDIVYIASNHHSHSSYAIKALNYGKRVYIEKPIAVNYPQFANLLDSKEATKKEVYVGYNRPFSKAISQLKEYQDEKIPLTLNCFVIGHKIEQDHWYRNPEEGTRVCGNMGHWIDLAVHLLAARNFVPESFDISISYTSESERDDNVAVTMTTEFKDLITIILSAREEPFEGINETINFQSGKLIAKIDDFRKMQVWKGSKYKNYSYKPKDVGHLKAINQPFDKEKRNFNEVVISTILMLEITDMVKKGERQRQIQPKLIKDQLLEKV